MIQLEKVNKTYDDGFEALKEINLSFKDEKINVLIGPSGCGKTTTMKLLNRLTDFTRGTITMNGENIQEINPIDLRRKMGYVIQNIGLFPHMTIYDNVAAVPKLLKFDKQKIKQRVEELLNMVNLDPEIYKDRYPSELSGGQQQRVGVIRALAAEPDTILMDEPFSALDPISREQLQDELIRLQKEIKKTIIFVTHDMDEAIKIADQIILMKEGEVVQKGTPNELMTNPVNDFVREFIGDKRLKKHDSIPPLMSIVHSEFPFVKDSSALEEAVQLMITNKVSYIPVVSKENTYVGIISIYEALNKSNSYVKEIMDTTFPAVKHDSNVVNAISTMSVANCSIIPVISETSQLIGVIDSHKQVGLLEGFLTDRGDEQ